MTETELNDLLRFEADTVYEWLGMRSETQIREEIKKAESELEDLQNDLADNLDDEELTAEERVDIIDSYQPDIDELKAKITELDNGDIELTSYNTIVCRIHNGVFQRLWDGYSATTMRHINAFIDFYGIKGGGKAWWMKLEIA